jgi:hypothetical protein
MKSATPEIESIRMRDEEGGINTVRGSCSLCPYPEMGEVEIGGHMQFGEENVLKANVTS